MNDFQLIDLGAFTAFQRKVTALDRAAEDREFRFRQLPEAAQETGQAGEGFWVFEEENEDNVFGGILHVTAGRVYAISEDVYEFVRSAMER